MKVMKGKFRPKVFWGLLILHVLAFYGVYRVWIYGFPFGAWMWFAGLYTASTVGVSMGYHRLFTHRAFECGSRARKVLAGLGGLAVEGPMWEWVRDHRTHHAFGDLPGDPHSPNNGFWWSHCLWVLFDTVRPASYKPLTNFDGATSRWQRRWYWHIVLLGFALPLLAGFFAGLYFRFPLAGAIQHGLLFLLLAGPVRVVAHLHATWAVNSFGHTIGFKPTNANGIPLSKDRSRNCWQILIPTFVGEWAHANHHAQPNCAYFGWKWYHPDLVKIIVRLLEKWGVVWEVVKPRPV